MTLLKSIVAALVLANVGYYLWARGIAAVPEADRVGPSLKLASEVPGFAAPGATAPSATAPSATAPAETAAPVPFASGASAAVDANLDAGSAPPAAPPAADAAPPGGQGRCVSVGPFREVSEAARAAGSLRSLGYDPRQRVADGEVWAGVWVYLPLPPTPAAAAQMLDKLKAGGIDDALEMPGPNDTSVISLGLFSEQKRAQARVAQAQALALTPAVTDRKRNGNVYWIDIDLKTRDAMPNPADLQGESSRSMRLEMKACPAASEAR